MSDKLTKEQIEARADELSTVHSCKVHALEFIDPETKEQIIGYIKEPNRVTKLRVLDKGMISPISAAAELFEAILIRDESNPRIFSEKPEDDSIYMGAVMECYNTIKVSVNQLKKN